MIEPVWIDTRDALALHERLLSIHGGAEGLPTRSALCVTIRSSTVTNAQGLLLESFL